MTVIRRVTSSRCLHLCKERLYVLAEYIVFGYLLRYTTAINANADMCIDGIEHTDEEIFRTWPVYSFTNMQLASI